MMLSKVGSLLHVKAERAPLYKKAVLVYSFHHRCELAVREGFRGEYLHHPRCTVGRDLNTSDDMVAGLGLL